MMRGLVVGLGSIVGLLDGVGFGGGGFDADCTPEDDVATEDDTPTTCTRLV